MGCKQSKPAIEEGPIKKAKDGSIISSPGKSSPGKSSDNSNTPSAEPSDTMYKMLAKSQKLTSTKNAAAQREMFAKVLDCTKADPQSAFYQNPTTKSTPLHMAVRLIDSAAASSNSAKAGSSADFVELVQAVIQANPRALAIRDAGGNIPLHYAVAPSTNFGSIKHNNSNDDDGNGNNSPKDVNAMNSWKLRAEIVRLLITSDTATAKRYMTRNDVIFESGDSTGGCTPLYRVIQTIPDDFEPKGPTYQFMVVVTEASPNMAGVGNISEGDKPLALLYRRFTRQFDISEKFFAGDNSRPEVVEHRRKYKAAAGNTWKIIELLLRPTAEEMNAAAEAAKNNESTASWSSGTKSHHPSCRIVHRAVQVETPPDLLRYIVETNPEDLTQVDHKGNSPLHYAAASKPPQRAHDTASFPAFYTKYVVDELLYKFPEGAQIKNASGKYPLTLAINSGKQWIGGGIKSLYDAFPQALEQTDLEPHPNLRRILSTVDDDESEKKDDDDVMPDTNTTPRMKDTVIKDEQHDAIMLVQQDDVDVAEVSTSMWAHEGKHTFICLKTQDSYLSLSLGREIYI